MMSYWETSTFPIVKEMNLRFLAKADEARLRGSASHCPLQGGVALDFYRIGQGSSVAERCRC
jgi:hypothetical protein